MTIGEKRKTAVWIARALFERGNTSGSTANLSFRHGEQIFVTCSGSCFGSLTEDDLVCVDSDGSCSDPERKPSKEYPLHKMLYDKDPEISAVIHVHSPYAVLWSCIGHDDDRDVFPSVTPYLDMKLGKVVHVPYAPPGSAELFAAFRSCLGSERGYLLGNHGPIVGGKSLMNAFEAIEELEQTAFVCWELKAAGQSTALIK